MRSRHTILASALALALATPALGQGTFQNLGFESPVLPLIYVSPGYPYVLASSAVPGWIPYLVDQAQSDVLYNVRTGGGSAVGLHDWMSSTAPLEGNYSLLLQPGVSPSGGGRTAAAVGQTGTVPAAAKSLRFLAAYGQFTVSFAGQSLAPVALSSGPNFSTLFGVDISGFAGQSGELRFTAPDIEGGPNDVFLDSIRFSTVAIPEPRVLALCALGVALSGSRLRRMQP